MSRSTADLLRKLRRDPGDIEAWLEYCRLASRLGEIAEMAELEPDAWMRDRLWKRVTSDIALVPVVLPLFGLRLPEHPRGPARWWQDNYRLGDAGSFHFDRKTGFPLEVERLSDGGRMVLVPEGAIVRVGREEGRDVVVRRTGLVQAFLADVHPVTVEQYEAFYPVGARPTPLSWAEQRQRPHRPVVGVSHHDAEAYAAWAGARLLGDLGWEKAARGPGGMTRPWASEGTATSRANVWDVRNGPPPGEEAWSEHLEEVGVRPDGVSAFGLEEVAGNVTEWCGDGLENLHSGRWGSGHFFKVRGSSWRSPSDQPLLGQQKLAAETRAMELGFRLGRPLSALVRSIDRLGD
jgi:formylglycine-generating enzyme required for sulfatase activity